jgi:hypothetical protein
MRRLLIALLFPILLIAQQGAFVHGLQHLPGAGTTSSTQDDRQAPSDQYCEKCFTFAHIGATAGLPAALVTVSCGVFEAIGFRLPIAPLAQVQSPRSRGPPTLL